jgi:hypothetical protein
VPAQFLERQSASAAVGRYDLSSTFLHLKIGFWTQTVSCLCRLASLTVTQYSGTREALKNRHSKNRQIPWPSFRAHISHLEAGIGEPP